MTAPLAHAVQGIDHTAFVTFRPAETVHFYRDVLGFPLVHAITAKGWGRPDQPDFIHFFFDIGAQGSIAFFYYLGVEAYEDVTTPQQLARARHLALRVETLEELDDYQARLEHAGFPLQYRATHETIESIYVNDPNGYQIEFARRLRPAVEADARDAALTVAALGDVVERGTVTLDALWARKAELIDAAAMAER
jgi:catechol 2,3-dioxygenase-like lactoylglutathione lyase family enzyme